MSVTLYAAAGIIMMIAVMAVLISGKTDPIIPMIAIPVLFAVLIGASAEDILTWTVSGMEDQLQSIAMFVFAIIFFGVMMDTGVFDAIVGKILKKANSVTAICILTVLATMVGHADGSGATTFLIVIPPFLMLYKKMNMRPVVLMCLVALTAGVMNTVPWGGPCGRLAGSFGLNATDIFVTLLPAFFAGLACCFLLALYMARKEIRRGAGLTAEAADGTSLQLEKTEEEKALLRPRYFWLNLAVILITIIVMFATDVPPYICFMVASAFSLCVNYPGSKMQSERLKTYAPACLTMTSVLLACGIFVGILSYSPMQESMTILLSEILSGETVTTHLNGILAYLWTILDQLGLDHYACCYTIVPMIQTLCASTVTPMQAAVTYLVSWVPLVFVHPTTPAMYIGLGLAGVSFKDHWKFSVKWGVLISWITITVLILLGVIPF